MDEDYTAIFENINKIIDNHIDYKTNLLIFNSFMKGFQLGFKTKSVDLTILNRFLKLNV